MLCFIDFDIDGFLITSIVLLFAKRELPWLL